MAYNPIPVSQSTFATTDDGWAGGSTVSNFSSLTAVPLIIKYDALFKAMVYTPPAIIPPNTGYYFVAPASYLGKQAKVYGGKLSFTLTLNGTAGSINLVQNNYNLVLAGGGLTIGINMFQGLADPTLASTAFNITIPIEAGKGWNKFTAPSTWATASADEIQTVVQNLTHVLILGNCASNLTSTALNSIKLIPKELPGQPMPLEIHTINVSQGDSILVINRDLYALENKIDQWIGTQPSPKPTKPADSADWLPFTIAKKIPITGTVQSAVLIDAGNKEFGINVINYLKDHGVEQGKFSVVITHYHDDHYDGFIYSTVSAKTGQPSNPDVLFWSYRPNAIYDCGNDTKFNPLTYKTAIKSNMQRYKSNIHDLCTKHAVTYKALQPNNTQGAIYDLASGVLSDSSIELGTASDPMQLYCVAANGNIWSGSAMQNKRPAGAKKEEQNSRSVALVLEYGDFRYYLAGDLGGAETKDNSQSKGEDYGTKQAVGSKGYWDIEIPLAERLPYIYKKDLTRPNTIAGHICCIKCSHHGSQWHTNTKLLRIVQPTVCVFSSGIKKTFHRHPTQETLSRVDYDTAKVATTTKNEYSPKWPDRTSGAPASIAQVDNSFKNSSAPPTYHYFITEMSKPIKTGKKSKRFNPTYPSGKIIGSIVVRPYLTDIIKILEKTSPNNTIHIQIYGSGETSDLYNTQKYATRLTAPESKNASYPATVYYPVGPWIHICDNH